MPKYRFSLIEVNRTLTYDAENNLTAVNGAATATFIYDGDGNRVKGIVSGVTTTYVGSHFEWSGSTSTMKKYYYAAGTRVAMRTGAGSGVTGLQWLVGDHLGSTAVTANASGTNKDAELRYKAWGETRYTSGTTPTTYRFTGQREQAEIGLYFYGSRWYDSSLSRWAQPDTLVPVESQGTQAWDRYAFVNNNPVKYIDPSGHMVDDGCKAGECGGITDLNKRAQLIADKYAKQARNTGSKVLWAGLNNH